MTDEVLVIGASGPGLLVAAEVARAGLPVGVYEQAERLAPQARTLIVTPALTQALGFVPESAILHRVGSFELRSNGTLARVELETPDLIIERAELIRLLAARAERAGARLHYGWRFCGFEVEHGRTVAVLVERGSSRVLRRPARAVIGADGAASAVARAAGRRSPPRVTNLQARVALPPGVAPETSCVWFAPEETRYFFWLIPESAETAVVGLAHDHPAETRPALDRFLRARGWEPLAYEAARVPLYAPGWREGFRVGDAEVHLVGDAAAQVKPTTVGGTVTGLWGARAAAAAIRGSRSHRHQRARLHRELAAHWLLRWMLNRFREDDYSALLRSLNGRVRALLRARSRDAIAGGFWSLVAREPRLVLLAGRAAALNR